MSQLETEMSKTLILDEILGHYPPPAASVSDTSPWWVLPAAFNAVGNMGKLSGNIGSPPPQKNALEIPN